jgi:hypothetical protein
MMKILRQLPHGRILVDRPEDGVRIYYDSHHKVSRVEMTDGTIHEVVYARQPEGSYRQQLYVTENIDGTRTLIES